MSPPTTVGFLSSVFDYPTFGVVPFLLHANTALFRTGWFVESVISAAMIVLVMRSRRPFFTSKPSTPLLPSTLLAGLLGSVPLPPLFLAFVAGGVGLYVLSGETTKAVVYRHAAGARPGHGSVRA